MKKVLFVVDLQKQFKDDKGQYEKCLKYIEENKDNYDYIIGTAFQNLSGSLYETKLDYQDCRSLADSDIEYTHDEMVLKLAEYGISEMRVVLSGIRISLRDDFEVHVIGCDSDACVLAIAFNLWDQGAEFKVLSDLVYTTATDFSNDDVLKIMKRNFGSCVTTSSEVYGGH